MPTLPERIRAIRNSLHYSRESMALELNISQTAYSYLENNDKDTLTIGRLARIASIFGVSMTELITGETGIQTERVSLNQQGGQTNGVVFSEDQRQRSARTIGDQIRQLREKQGLLQRDMAKRMGISQKNVQYAGVQ